MFEFTLHAVKKGGWAPIAVFLTHIIATQVFHIYRDFPDFDIPMHFLGGLTICYFYTVCLHAPNAEIFLGRHTKFSSAIILTSLTGMTTILWEFAEWTLDHLTDSNAQVSLDDTMGDIFMGLMGGPPRS